MASLAVWRVDSPQRDKTVDGGTGPQPQLRAVERSHIGLERDFEDWIANDSALIEEGLTSVDRQMWVKDGRHDLLAINSRYWGVVIDIKPGILHTGELTQTLSYASSIAQLYVDRFCAKLESNRAVG